MTVAQGADGNKLVDPNFKRLYIGLSATTSISYRLLKKTETYIPSPPPFKGVFNLRNEREKPYPAYNLGFRFGVNVTRFLAIETGVSYSSLVYQFVDKNQWNPGGYGYGYDTSSSTTFKIKNGYHFIDIPLGLNFQLGKKKCRALIGVGGAINIAMGEWSYLRIKNNGDDKIILERKNKNPYSLPQRRINFSPFLTVGFSYAFHPSLTLYVAPTFSMQSLENIVDTQITEYLWATGLNVGLNFGFLSVK